MVSISDEQRYSTETMSIFAMDGSIGNSDILRPVGVRSPTLSRAPRTQSWYMEFKILDCRRISQSRRFEEQSRRTWGGGSMKSNSKRFLTPSDFSSSTVFARFVR